MAAAVLRGLVLQLTWGVVLTIAGMLVLRTATRRMILYGG